MDGNWAPNAQGLIRTEEREWRSNGTLQQNSSAVYHCCSGPGERSLAAAAAGSILECTEFCTPHLALQ